jgi:hypothetical protein
MAMQQRPFEQAQSRNIRICFLPSRPWPHLKSDVTAEPCLNVAVAAVLAAGLVIDPDEIGEPSIVIAA